MDIRFCQPGLTDLDGLRVDALVLSFFSDERPLRGAGGLVDWRLCGALSRQLVSGFVTGADGERVLVPCRGRIGAERVILFGLGREAAFSVEHGAQRVTRMLEVAAGTGARTIGMVAPGRSTRIVDGATAMESVVQARSLPQGTDELILLEPTEGQREMVPVLERERRRARAPVYG